MINVPLTRAEALLMIELLNRSHDSLTQALLNAVEDENNHDEVVRAAKQNYIANLQQRANELEKEVNSLKKTQDEEETWEKFEETFSTPRHDPKSIWGRCYELIKDIKDGESKVVFCPENMTFKQFRTGVTSLLSQCYQGQYKTRCNQETESMVVYKLTEFF